MTVQEAIGQLRCNVEGDYINLDDLEAFELAILALGKQIPKKVTFHKSHYRCPSCNDIVVGGGFCKYCGQAIDWGVIQ